MTSFTKDEIQLSQKHVDLSKHIVRVTTYPCCKANERIKNLNIIHHSDNILTICSALCNTQSKLINFYISCHRGLGLCMPSYIRLMKYMDIKLTRPMFCVWDMSAMLDFLQFWHSCYSQSGIVVIHFLIQLLHSAIVTFHILSA